MVLVLGLFTRGRDDVRPGDAVGVRLVELNGRAPGRSGPPATLLPNPPTHAFTFKWQTRQVSCSSSTNCRSAFSASSSS